MDYKFKGSADYQNYTRSGWWRRRKEKFWAKFKKVCFCCNGQATEIHHNSYERVGREDDKDLVALCRECHAEITDMVYRKEAKLKEAHVIYRQILSLRI